MNQNPKLAMLVAVLALTAILPACAFADPAADACKGALLNDVTAFAMACTDTAANKPYEFAWLLLAKICPLDKSCSQGATNNEECRCPWQDWATNDHTFPIHPRKEDPPTWPDSGKWPLDDGDDLEFRCESSVEKVTFDRRRNQPEFEYIIHNDLWYQDGLKAAYNDEKQINFPQNSVAVAVAWKKISKEERDKYYWKTLPDGTTCGMTNIDIKSKILPKWFFFSFEHVDNPGRCDFTGCRDDFGQDPRFVPPIFRRPIHTYLPDQLDKRPVYPPGTLVPRLTSLITLSDMWKKNYRLKGVQTDFTTADGKPTILAGSQIEGKAFPASSSCMTCHAQAGFDSQGHNLRGRGAVGNLESPNGVPDPAWFYDMGPDGWQLRYKQVDLLWAVVVNACPLECPSNPTESERLPHRCNCD